MSESYIALVKQEKFESDLQRRDARTVKPRESGQYMFPDDVLEDIHHDIPEEEYLSHIHLSRRELEIALFFYGNVEDFNHSIEDQLITMIDERRM